MRRKRAVLFIRCSTDEAQAIQEAARRERRTISAFVLHAVSTRLSMQEKIDRVYAKQIARDIMK